MTSAPPAAPPSALEPASLRGAGWICGDAYGTLAAPARRLPAAPPSLRRWAALAGLGPFRTDGAEGLDERTARICFSVALALQDGGALGAQEALSETGIVATDRDGCILENERCFRDYASAGRTLARGALFIRTLPTSAACEAAIRLGLEGPTAHVGTRRGNVRFACERALASLRRGEARAMVVSSWSPAGAVALLFSADARPRPGAAAAVAVPAAPDDLGSVFQALRARGLPEIEETK